MRSNTFTPKKEKPPFRQKDAESVTYCGELPYQHRGKITPALYVWNSKHPVRWVDRRDLPGLLKAAGADNLDSDWVREYKARKAEKAQKRKEKKEQRELELESAPVAQSEEVGQ